MPYYPTQSHLSWQWIDYSFRYPSNAKHQAQLAGSRSYNLNISLKTYRVGSKHLKYLATSSGCLRKQDIVFTLYIFMWYIMHYASIKMRKGTVFNYWYYSIVLILLKQWQLYSLRLHTWLGGATFAHLPSSMCRESATRTGGFFLYI